MSDSSRGSPLARVVRVPGATPSSTAVAERPLVRLAPWLIVVAVLAAYANAFRGPFVFDDPSSIVANPTIRHLWPPWSAFFPPNVSITVQGRPLLNFSFALNYAVSGNATWSYHALNVAIHVAAALALYGVIRRTLRRHAGRSLLARDGNAGIPSSPASRPLPADSIAFAAALLWAVHPLQTEAIDYVVQRAESLMGMFFLLAFYGFVRAVEAVDPRRWYGVALGSCILGALTKEVMVAAPPLLLLYDRTFVSGSFREALRRRGAVHAALWAVTWLIVGMLVLAAGGNRGGSVGFGVGISWWAYPLTQLEALSRYLGLSFWPHPLVFEYGSYWITRAGEVLPWVVPVLALLAFTVVGLVRRPVLGFLGAWLLLILAPTSLAPGTTQMIVEHRMYLPLASVMLALVLGLHAWLRRRMLVAAIAVAIVFAAVTYRRNAVYQSEVGLWSDTVARRPDNPLAHQMLAMALEHAGDRNAAIDHYEAAVRLKPNFALAHDTLGELLYRVGRKTEATDQFVMALRLQPNFADAHDHLAVALSDAGQADEALPHAEAAIRLRPNYAEAEFHLANILAELDRGKDAIPHYEAALRQKPDFPAAHYNLGNSLALTGRVAEALSHYETAVSQKPDYVEAYNNLGSALLALGRTGEAIAKFERALQLNPNFTDARTNLDRISARSKSGRTKN